MKNKNPFLISGYQEEAYFCDREEETEQLIKYIENHVNISLFAYRRLGKTGLVKHVHYKLKNKKSIVCIYLDILGTTELKSFTNLLATSIYNAFPKNNSIGKKVIKAIQSLRPTINFDEFTGSPSVSFNIDNVKQTQTTIQQLFQFLDNQNIQISLAIDEFQQVLEYPEKNTDAILRTQMQELQNIQFIFCGSNQKMMHEIFNNAKRPFFASCTPIHLGYIQREKYTHFIKEKFNTSKRKIDKEALDFICDWTMRHTYYTQYFCNFIHASNHTNINLDIVHSAANEILKVHENTFFQYRNLLTASQWKTLKAIGKEEQLFQPNAKSFIQKYRLGTPSSVNRVIQSLLTKEMIFYNTSVEKPYYEVYDKFLMRWLAKSE
ncbi:MAG: ATP-binding protein [Brumimicrobium sp.]